LTPCRLDNNSVKRINIKGWGEGDGSLLVSGRGERKKRRGAKKIKERECKTKGKKRILQIINKWQVNLIIFSLALVDKFQNLLFQLGLSLRII
jgi:hypothetical protein